MALLKRSLGVSLGRGGITFAELEKVAGHVRVLRSGAIPDTTLAVADGQADPWRGLSKGARPHVVVLALPRRAVILRTLEVPVAEDKDLAGLIGYELEQHLPFSPEEAYWAFQTMSRDGSRLRVLLAAARKSDVDPHLERLDAAGLRPDAVTVSVLGAANALLARAHRRDAAALCIVEQGGSEAEVTVLRDGSVLSSRAVPVDGETGASIVAEIERAETAAGAPAAVWMAGSDDVREGVARGLQRSVKRWDAPARVAPSAYGAALQGLRRPPFRMDLLPAERRAPTRERALQMLFVLLPVVLLLGGGLLAGQAYRERQTLERFRADVAAVRADAAKVETLKAQAAELQNRSKILAGLSRERGQSLLILKEVAAILPRDVALTEFVVDGNKLVIRGTTGGSPAEMIAAFEKSSVFENAAFTSPIAAQGRDRQGFQLQAFVREQARAASPEPRARSREPRAESAEPDVESPEPRPRSPEPRAQKRGPRAPSPEPRAPSRPPTTQGQELGVDD